MYSRRAGLVMLALFAVSLSAKAPEGTKRSDPTKGTREVPLFRLGDPRTGKTIDLKGMKDAKGFVVVFLGTQCPINNEYIPELNRIEKDYAPKGIRLVGVNANKQDAPATVAEYAKKYAAGFPIVKDPRNEVADTFGARRTPEAFLLSPTGEILYQGRIDDQFGVDYRRPGRPTRRDLVAALDELLDGKPISTPRTEAAGCFIGRAKKPSAEGKVTFTKDISRILQKNCQDCHRPGQIGPMSLVGYDDVSAWAETIREVVDDGRMPPWYADPRHGKWANGRVLSKDDKAAIRAWVAAGAPRGDEADMPAPRAFPRDWQIGKPDIVYTMPSEFDVPAETPKAGIPYKYFSVQPDFTEDRWIERAEAKAGAPEVVHHILIFIVPAGQSLRMDAPGGVLTGMAPGDMPMVLEPGYAKKLPAGARLVFQMHYTPNGRAQKDRSSVGLVFAKGPPKHRVLTKPIHNSWFYSGVTSIPPDAENFSIVAKATFAHDVQILGLLPHMHLRGKDFVYEAVRPDGKKETILSVPKFNFNWQSVYRPEKPIRLAKGTTLRCEAHFDNSAKNPQNPDPKKRLYWGDQTWEEMMIGWIDYVEVKE